jgi:nucleoside phosphorylase
MLRGQMFTLKDVKDAAEGQGNWFSEQSKHALAGRCLLDATEYLRAHPKFPGQFRQLLNAHVIRLLATCLPEITEVGTDRGYDRLTAQMVRGCKSLLSSRKNEIPHYGDDFWDWAQILECFIEVNRILPKGPIDKATLNLEFKSFRSGIAQHLENGLQLKAGNEWYGPAMAVAAWRVLSKWRALSGLVQTKTIDLLKQLALEPIGSNGRYRNQKIGKEYLVWHLGQVVAAFPRRGQPVWRRIRSFCARIDDLSSPAQRVYVLARFIQGAAAMRDQPALDRAIRELFRFDNPERPLGEGIIGENIKGSVNILEVLWPLLSKGEKHQTAEMLQALREVQRINNKVSIVVAIRAELTAVREAFENRGAKTWLNRDDYSLVVDHRDYRVVVRQGKSIIGVSKALAQLLTIDKPRWVIMVGIAGSLGTDGAGPQKGDVVLATSLAPYRIRDKVRSIVENAGVPFDDLSFGIIPVDPGLFVRASRAAAQIFPEGSPTHVWQGQIVTGTGIKDSPAEKVAILAEFPGGVAVEEEGYVVGLHCMSRRTPYLVIRGVSDFAGGDKQERQRTGHEDADQLLAAKNAASIAVMAIQRLSSRW